MCNRYLVIVGIMLAIAGVVVTAARDTAPQGAGGREYGILRTTSGTFSWYESTGYVRNKPPSEFADLMKVPRAMDNAALEINLLNGLEQQGWQLTFVPQAGVYIFAKPRQYPLP